MSLTPGRLSTPEDTSSPGAPVSRSAATTLSGVRPTGEQPRVAGFHPLQKRPVEGLAVATGPVGARWRAGIEQQVVGHGIVGRDHAEIGAGPQPERADHRQPEGAAHGGDTGRCLDTMQLQQIGRQGRDDRGEFRIVGIDGHASTFFARPPTCVPNTRA